MATPQGLTPLEAADEIRNANNGQVVLVLQGGGALGAYQGGVYQALHDAGIGPDWLIGTNASLIAGNKVEDRLDKLQEFWRRVERSSLWGAFPASEKSTSSSSVWRVGPEWNVGAKKSAQVGLEEAGDAGCQRRP
jgi:NTE family protein